MKKLSLILTIILIASALGGGLSTVAFAATNGIESSSVLSDLQNSKIAGEDFNADNYGYTDERAPQVLAFAEYGFAFKSASDYAIYIYVYNPTGKEIKANRNSISVATVYENGSAVDYDKFALKLLDVSDGKYARLFYKFKIADPTKLHTRVAANTNARRYDVSEIELNFGDFTSEAFDVGNYYEYSGYAQGFGADSKAESSLTCTTDRIDVLGLDVKLTNYLYYNAVSYADSLTTAYFGVPNKIFDKYGKLQQIKANWYETQTAPILVVNNLAYYNEMKSKIGISFGGNEDFFGQINGDKILNLSALGNPFFADPKSDYRVIDELTWWVYSKDGIATSEQLLDYAKDYSQKAAANLLLGKYSSNLFFNDIEDKRVYEWQGVGAGRQYGWQGTDGNGIVIDADAVFSLNGFDMGSRLANWWYNLFADYDNTPTDTIKPIDIVSEKDLTGSDSDISAKLQVGEKDVSTLKATFEENRLAEKQTVLFRFATTKTRYGDLQAHPNSIVKYYDIGTSYLQNVFLDFDIIWLKFIENGQVTVIPCVSSPVDFFGGVQPVPTNNNRWVIIVAVVIVVVLFIVLFKLLKVLFRKKNQR